MQGLNRLEERLIALRLPFMNIRLRSYPEQWFLQGNVVNVENDLDTCVSVLPRKFSETSVVQVQLMRKMSYDRPYIFDKVRPARIVAAVKYLLGSTLYMKANVVMSEDWAKNTEGTPVYNSIRNSLKRSHL